MSKNSKHTAPPGDLKGSFLRMIFIIQAIWANRPSPQNLPHWQLHQHPPLPPAVGDDIICAVLALKISCFVQSEQLLMRLQVLGMMVCWSIWVVSLGNRGVGSQLLGGPVSGSDPGCHAGSRRKRPKGAFLTQIHIRVVLIGQKFLDCDWRNVQLRAKLLEAFFFAGFI